jgi:hypothetical protein
MDSSDNSASLIFVSGLIVGLLVAAQHYVARQRGWLFRCVRLLLDLLVGVSPDRFDDQGRDLCLLLLAHGCLDSSRSLNWSLQGPSPRRFDQSQRARKPD